MIRTIIVDDEPHALEYLENTISIDRKFDIIGQCANAFEAIRDINNKHPDVVFLDITMPKLSGMEMLSMLDKNNMPRIVFVTAHSEYAIEAFEKNAIDFLLKPVKNDRLNITLGRLKENHQPQPAVTEVFPRDLKFVPCWQGNQNFLIPIKEIIHVFSSPTTGAHLVTRDNRQFHTNLPLKVFDDNSQLIRCHRQHMVNPDYIKLIKYIDNGLGEIHADGNHIIPISRKYMHKFPPLV